MRYSNFQSHVFFFFFCVIISLANSQSRMNQVVKPMKKPTFNETTYEQNQMMRQLKAVFDEFNKRDEKLTSQIESMSKELSELTRSNAELKQSVFVTQPHFQFRYFDEYYKKEPTFRGMLKEQAVSFALKGYPFTAEAKFQKKDTSCLHAIVAFKNESDHNRALNLTLIPAIYFKMADYKNKYYYRETNYPFGAVLQYNAFNYDTPIFEYSRIGSSELKTDIHVEPPQLTQNSYSYDGSLKWAVKDFRQKRQMENQTFVLHQSSPYFYTNSKGYRVQVRLMLNGTAEYKGKGLTAQINFLTGLYDAELSPSFPHHTTISCFHPTDPTKHLVKSVGWELRVNETSYNVHMGSHAEMDELLGKEDTLYYQVRIVPASKM